MRACAGSKPCIRPRGQSARGCTCKALLPVLHPCACLGAPVPLDVVGDVHANGEFVRVWIPAAGAGCLKSPATCETATSASLCSGLHSALWVLRQFVVGRCMSLLPVCTAFAALQTLKTLLAAVYASAQSQFLTGQHSLRQGDSHMQGWLL